MADQASLKIAISEKAGYAAFGGAGATSVEAKAAFKTLASLIEDSIAPFREELGQSEVAPDETEITLRIALQAEGKWLIVSLNTEAEVSIKLVWKRPR